jgi:diadenosine tetraphosphatase ApaH/serine/threonine PP2A family protein phosphatase
MFESDSDAAYRGEAQDSTRWTRQALTPENMDYLRNLPKGQIRCEGFGLVHGSPVDEDQYLVKASDVEPLRSSLRVPLTFFGHTHVQGGFVLTGDGVAEIDPGKPVEIDPTLCHYLIINPGSVGQPRDGNWRAAFAIYCPDEHRVEFARVSYPAGKTAEKIVLAGMPAMLGARLLMGK